MRPYKKLYSLNNVTVAATVAVAVVNERRIWPGRTALVRKWRVAVPGKSAEFAIG